MLTRNGRDDNYIFVQNISRNIKVSGVGPVIDGGNGSVFYYILSLYITTTKAYNLITFSHTVIIYFVFNNIG